MMKKLILLSLLLVAGFTLAACGEKEDIGDRTEINFWNISPVGSESYSGMRRIIRDFNESQDAYFVRSTGINFWDYWDRVNVAIASGNAPDVALHTIDNVVLRASNGALYNITELIEADIAAGRETIAVENYLENQLDVAAYDGNLYALPFSATTRVLYYNLDLFEEAGLSETDVPTTWSELHTVAKQLDDVSGNTINVLGFDPSFGEGTYKQFLWQSGLDYFDEDFNVTLDTPEHLEILEWMYDFNSEYSRSALDAFGEANEMLGINPFAAGNLGMMIASDGLYETLRPLGDSMRYGVAPIPLPDENGVRVNWGSGFSIEMYDNGDEARKQGAWEFMKYLMTYEVQQDMAEVLGWLMSSIPAMTDYAEGNPILEAFIEELNYAVDKVYVPYAPNWHAVDWDQYFEEGLRGAMTAEEVLQAAISNYIQKRENYEAAN